MRTYVYVDGFNLYYGAVRDTPHKWLDLKALFSRILRPENRILAIKYYTAKVSARPGDPGAPTRQTIYLNALKAHIPELEVTLGHFLQSKVRMRLASPKPWRKTEEVIKTEEKGSHVSLALHVLNDAWENRCDCAVVCSNDSDFAKRFDWSRPGTRRKLFLSYLATRLPGRPRSS